MLQFLEPERVSFFLFFFLLDCFFCLISFLFLKRSFLNSDIKQKSLGLHENVEGKKNKDRERDCGFVKQNNNNNNCDKTQDEKLLIN